METFQRIPFLAQNSVFRKLAEITDISTLSKEEREIYDERIKRYRDTMAVIDYAVKEERAKERAKGRAEGLAEGRAEGEAKGEVKGQAKLVSNMLKSGMSIASIASCTGLTDEELVQLINMNGTQPLA